MFGFNLTQVAFALRRKDFKFVETRADNGSDCIRNIDHIAHLVQPALDQQFAIDAHAIGEWNLFVDHLFLEIFVIHIEINGFASFIINAFPTIAAVGQYG